MTLNRQKIPAEYAKAKLTPHIKPLMQPGWTTLLLIGPAGTGKTTVLWGLHKALTTGKEFAGQHPVHVISECADIDRYRYEWDWLEDWAKFPGRLCVDDIGYRKPTDWTYRAIYHLTNYRRQFQLKTIWTTNLTTEQLTEYYGAAIASRLMGGVVFQTGGADKRIVKPENF
jgi:DNA replication protein DnaC